MTSIEKEFKELQLYEGAIHVYCYYNNTTRVLEHSEPNIN